MRKVINWNNFKVGDFIIHPSGDRAKILAKTGKVFAKSGWYNYDALGRWMTVEEAQAMDLRFIQPGNKVEMTAEEIEVLIGHPVKIKR